MSKKGFDASRDSVYVYDPLDVCIAGGRSLPKEEQGPLDTVEDVDHPCWDQRLHEPVLEEFIQGIDRFGVKQPICIAKIDDKPVVVYGRKRVRAARLVNQRRAERGELPLKIRCTIERGKGNQLTLVMILENEARVNDSIMVKIEKLKRVLDRGVAIEDAAAAFNENLPTVRKWLAFDDNAINATKRAVDSGRLSASAAMTIAREHDPTKQAEALDAALANGGQRATVNDARRAVAGRTARKEGGDGVGLTSKRAQARLLGSVTQIHKEAAAKGHQAARGRPLDWWRGVEAALRLVTGEGEPVAALKEVIDAPATTG